MKKRRNNFDKWFLLSWKKIAIVLIAWIVAFVLHNLGSALISIILGTEFEEAVFFLLATIVIPVYFIISIIYTLIRKLKRRK